MWLQRFFFGRIFCLFFGWDNNAKIWFHFCFQKTLPFLYLGKLSRQLSFPSFLWVAEGQVLRECPEWGQWPGSARGAASGCGESRNGRLVGSTQQATPAWAVAMRATLGWATHCHMLLGHFWEGHMLRGLSGSYSENICSTIVEEFHEPQK